MKTVFVLQHLHELAYDREDVKFIGVYATREDVKAAILRLRDKPGFKKFPNVIQPDDVQRSGFYIDEREVGQDSWTEGFLTT